MAKWMLKNPSANIAEISKSLNISEIMAKLLVNRGFRTYAEALDYLQPDIKKLPSSFEITGMEEAVCKTLSHIRKGSRLAIYGDYDVDGVMSAVILSKCLEGLGADFIYYVPDREKEGYGLNPNAVKKMAEMGVNIIIACDNGISSVKESHLIYENGMELIIIDHHEPPYDKDGNDILPRAEAIIDPKTNRCKYPFKHMCAAGLCYRFGLALFEKAEQELPDSDDLLIFAAIATICDIVDLLGDNRIIVKNGLDKIAQSSNLGLKALLSLYELYEKKQISVYHIGFIIGPTINASGRLESARTATELFLTKDNKKAAEMAAQLFELNKSRRSLTEDAYIRLSESLNKSEIGRQKVYVLYDDEIHESIAGIVAGRIKERWYHPTIVITKGDTIAKGSARSIEGYNIFDAFSSVSDVFEKFGGHSQAAGFSISYENINALRERLNSLCALADDDFIPKIYIESRLPLGDISFELCDDLHKLSPCGKGNKEPIFAEKNVIVNNIEFIGKANNIIKMRFNGYPHLSAISFDLFDKFMEYFKLKLGMDDKNEISCKVKQSGLPIDIAYTVSKNEFMGKCSLQLIIKDFR